MGIIFKYAWIMFVAVTIANAYILRSRANKFIEMDPSLAEGYQNLFKGYLFYGNVPWIIIAIGNLSGITNNIFDYFNPRAMNPTVLIFHGSMILLWILIARWIYFKDGAEFLERHPGFLHVRGIGQKSSHTTAMQIKLIFPLILLGGLAGMIMMWVSAIPLPRF